MDRQEAIERIKQNKAAAEYFAQTMGNYGLAENELKDIEAFNMAIEALQFQDIMINNPKTIKPTPEVCKNCKNNDRPYEPTSDDLIIKGAKGIKDGLYNIQNGELFQYKAKGGTVRTYSIVDALQDDWIPVSEPPKENGNYIVSLEDAVDTYARFFNGKWFMPLFGSIAREYGEYEVIAWMPLPEPYKESENEFRK